VPLCVFHKAQKDCKRLCRDPHVLFSNPRIQLRKSGLLEERRHRWEELLSHTRDKGGKFQLHFFLGTTSTLKGWCVNKENLVRAGGDSFTLMLDLTGRGSKALLQKDLYELVLTLSDEFVLDNWICAASPEACTLVMQLKGFSPGQPQQNQKQIWFAPLLHLKALFSLLLLGQSRILHFYKWRWWQKTETKNWNRHQDKCKAQVFLIPHGPEWSSLFSHCELEYQKRTASLFATSCLEFGHLRIWVFLEICFYGANPSIVIESFELEGTLKGHLVQLPYSEQGHPQLNQVFRAPSSLILNVSLGILCQCFTALIVTFFHISNLNLSLFFIWNHFPLYYHNRPRSVFSPFLSYTPPLDAERHFSIRSSTYWTQLFKS